MLFVVTVVFVITFLPAFLMVLKLIPYNIIVFYFYFANNVANPFIYSFMNQVRSTYSRATQCTPCLKKTVQNCFCQNFVEFPPILIILGRKMAKRLKLCEVHSFSTSQCGITFSA